MDYTNDPELNASVTHQFWGWKHKIQGVLQRLSLLSSYAYSEVDSDPETYGLQNPSQTLTLPRLFNAKN
ncbi:hypothetical protein [Hymenobacter guriensis]|uniref:Uncharacterized protein n=1 Tax=Hymenobacter guriensis TaxID=2793065 RepID=A0ABS0KVN8_9BACT|nr:hypothetical protein [Hymenobacter guriensis]MBG8551933.1 hypothetical protein [Hymenobacter guriensis]